jgi:hypothetical protein
MVPREADRQPMIWRTKLDHPAIPPGQELHAVFLEPIGDQGGACSTIALQVPEATEREVGHAFTTAARFQMRMVIITDTAEQAAEFAKLATTKLPMHRRVAFERAQAGAMGPPS